MGFPGILSCFVVALSNNKLASFGHRQGAKEPLIDASNFGEAPVRQVQTNNKTARAVIEAFSDSGAADRAVSSPRWWNEDAARNCSAWGLNGRWEDTRRRKVYHAIVVNDELELLEVLLYEIYPVVDVIIIVESSTAFTGFAKEMHFLKNQKAFEPYMDKIRRIQVDFKKELPNIKKAFGYRYAWMAWEFEEWQRHAVLRGAQDMADDDIFILGDVDEIVSREYMNAVAHCDPFPKLKQSGQILQSDCEVQSLFLFAFQWHFGCYVSGSGSGYSDYSDSDYSDSLISEILHPFPPRHDIRNMSKEGWCQSKALTHRIGGFQTSNKNATARALFLVTQ